MSASRQVWTAPSDSRLRRMRQEGAAWEAIAEALHVSPLAAMQRALRIGAQTRLCAGGNGNSQRDPLPAGDPTSWKILTTGTWLAGTRYPGTGDGSGGRR